MEDAKHLIRVLTDLGWIEDNFNGVMPFEALIDCGEEGKALSPYNLKRIERFQNLLDEFIWNHRSRPKLTRCCDQSLFGLTVKRRILYHTIEKDLQIILDIHHQFQ